MNRKGHDRIIVALGCLLLAVAALGLRTRTTSASPANKISGDASSSERVPVLVELFTSEGCSSCPPADGVLARLERAQPIAGARIIPLAFHVDYWDSLGWSDPFASSASTARQRAYAPLGGGTYTPQAVIDGRTELVGSRSGALEQGVERAARQAHVRMDIDVRAIKDAFEVTVRTGPLPEAIGAAPKEAQLLLAVTQSSARVSVPRGENAGQTLEHTAIVRELRDPIAVGAQGGTATFTVHAPDRVAPSEVRLVAFVQQRDTRAVLGSQSRPLLP
jgi:hypothetical protein